MNLYELTIAREVPTIFALDQLLGYEHLLESK